MQIREIPISRLKFAEYNPRVQPEKAIRKLARSIERVGFTNPVLVQERTNAIIAGHAG